MDSTLNIDELIKSIVGKLKVVRGVEAIVLGGSRATGTNRPDSDVDLGIYYSSNKLLNIDEIKALADDLNDAPNPTVTGFNEWGKWVNGGAWLTVNGQRVDFLYRDLDFVDQIINKSLNGEVEMDYYQQPPYGFYSYIYCAEINVCKVLFESNGSITKLKSKVSNYPELLKTKIINYFLWSSEFSLKNAKKYVQRQELYLFSGCLTRIISNLVQVIYALNEEYFINDKRLYKDIQVFDKKPSSFMDTINSILSNTGTTAEELNSTFNKVFELFNETTNLTEGIYKPKFNLAK